MTEQQRAEARERVEKEKAKKDAEASARLLAAQERILESKALREAEAARKAAEKAQKAAEREAELARSKVEKMEAEKAELVRMRAKYVETEAGDRYSAAIRKRSNRGTILSTLEWVVEALRMPESRMPVVDDSNRVRMNMLHHYLEHPEEQVLLFRRYEDLLHKTEVHKRKMHQDQKKTQETYDKELCRRVIREFLTQAEEIGLIEQEGPQTFQEAERRVAEGEILGYSERGPASAEGK